MINILGILQLILDLSTDRFHQFCQPNLMYPEYILKKVKQKDVKCYI